MWIITVFSKENSTKMYEFETEKEAREAFKGIQGCKILTEIVHINNQYPALVNV